MLFRHSYRTPDGLSDIVMLSDGHALTGLHFIGTGAVAMGASDCEATDISPFREACRWLDIYFSGCQPDFTPPYRLVGATPFREEVVREMLKIPFGATTTYGEIAAKVAARRGLARMSAQAVGGAVGWNPICLVIPCHRVMGAHGAITGYGGGIQNKAALLAHESFVLSRGSLPRQARIWYTIKQHG